MKHLIFPAALFGLFLLADPIPASVQVANGFDISDTLIPRGEILSGGPPREGIPALTDPARETVEQAGRWLRDEDIILGVETSGESVAYPIRILNWHEIVNDRVGGMPVAVTYCPLCGTGVVFNAMLQGRRAIFGVSGLLYKSDVLMYDRATNSLFSQLLMQGVSGEFRGQRLVTVPAVTTTWKVWRESHPDTQVLSHSLPFGRDYSTDPYRWYRDSGSTMFSVRGVDPAREPKEWAFLVLAGEEKFLVAEETLDRSLEEEPGRLLLAKTGLILIYDPENRDLRVGGSDADGTTVISGYWFALSAFHPDALKIDEAALRRTDGENSPSGPVREK